MSDRFGTPEDRYRGLSALYDDLFPFDDEATETVSFLASLAPGGRVLELAVGTGRIGIPLAARGCDVTGVDASPDMLRKLRAKDPAGTVRTVQSDMVAPDVSGQFDLIYLVANSLFELPSQELQVSCIASAARRLRDQGRLVIETAIPNRIFANQRPISVGPMDTLDLVNFQVMHYDQISQIVEYRHVFITNGAIAVYPTVHRFVYLPELDLMAALGGLVLTGRHGDWTGGPLNMSIGRCISVYATKDQAG